MKYIDNMICNTWPNPYESLRLVVCWSSRSMAIEIIISEQYFELRSCSQLYQKQRVRASSRNIKVLLNSSNPLQEQIFFISWLINIENRHFNYLCSIITRRKKIIPLERIRAAYLIFNVLRACLHRYFRFS